MAQATSSQPRPRGVRIGKYKILRHIAAGGMGAVYRAYDTASGREVALKVLSPDLAARPEVVDRFRREAQCAARLRHENIVGIYECGEATGTCYLALELVDGVDLDEHLRERGKLDPHEVWPLLIQAGRALQHAHEQGIVHRDIKPGNFLLTQRDGQPLLKLTDLGLARNVRAEGFRLTRLGTTVGTVDYLSPEQARDSATADIRSDIYSLGCTAYHLLAGKPPFSEGTMTERICKHMEAEPPDIRTLNPAVGPELLDILRRMLEKKPENRFQTPGELLAALERDRPARSYPGQKKTPRPARIPAAITEIATAVKTVPLHPRRKPPLPAPATRQHRRPAETWTIIPDQIRPERSQPSIAALCAGWWPWVATSACLVVLSAVMWLLLTQGGGMVQPQ